MYATCRGSGSPTVVLISGTGGAADEWTGLPPPPTPSTSGTSAVAVLPALSADTRVCAYDRPGTTREDGALPPSTPVAEPTTARQGVQDLRDLLEATRQQGPVLLVGASWGGMTWPAWLAAQDDLARAWQATHLSVTHSGHGIQVEQPALVTSAIRDVLAQARGK